MCTVSCNFWDCLLRKLHENVQEGTEGKDNAEDEKENKAEIGEGQN